MWAGEFRLSRPSLLPSLRRRHGCLLPEPVRSGDGSVPTRGVPRRPGVPADQAPGRRRDWRPRPDTSGREIRKALVALAARGQNGLSELCQKSQLLPGFLPRFPALFAVATLLILGVTGRGASASSRRVGSSPTAPARRRPGMPSTTRALALTPTSWAVSAGAGAGTATTRATGTRRSWRRTTTSS